MEKAKIRQFFKNQLKNQSLSSFKLSEKLVLNLQTVLPWSECAVVASYFPLKGEPDLKKFQALNPHICFVYPRTVKKASGFDVWELAPSSGEDTNKKEARDHQTKPFPSFGEDTVKTSSWGGVKPFPSERKCSFDHVEVFLIPGVAFDKHGGRLGRGGGVYDRMLSQSSCVKIGLCFSSQVFKQRLPLTETDQKMDALVTDREVCVFSPSVFQKRTKREARYV